MTSSHLPLDEQRRFGLFCLFIYFTYIDVQKKAQRKQKSELNVPK